jgi:nodulation protein E
MATRRVVITGLGVVSALGHRVPDFWAALSAGRSGIAPLQRVDRTKLRFQNAAEVRSFNPLDYLDEKRADMLDRFAQFALVAAREAVTDASIPWTPELRERTCITTGTSIGGEEAQDSGFIELYRENRTRVHPLTVPRVMPNAAASHISMEFGITGPVYTISTACSSSNHSIGQAFWMVRNGLVDMAISGGSEAPLTFGHLKAWEALRVISLTTCRPFSKNRDGMILGEGGAMMVLEPLEVALARGARIYAEIVGLGMSADAFHLTQPSVEGAARAVRAALKDGNVPPEGVGYINAHGTATAANDSMETRAIRTVYGAHADGLAVSSTKSMHGHALGGAGAIEGVATVLALYHSLLPPTMNYAEPDPACDLDVVPNLARPAQVEFAVSHSFAFGGLNAVLAFRRWEK